MTLKEELAIHHCDCATTYFDRRYLIALLLKVNIDEAGTPNEVPLFGYQR